MSVAQTLAPMTMAISFSTGVTPSLTAPSPFAKDGTGSANASLAKTLTARTKGGGNRTGGAEGTAKAGTPARYAFCPPPAFPAEARKARMAGTVVLTVQIDARGRPLSIAVRNSSGHAILDTAAMRAVRSWRFEPAQRDGRPVDACLEIPVRFALS